MSEPTTTWPDLAIALYDKLTERGAEITYDFDDLELTVPVKAGDQDGGKRATWKINGTLRIRTADRGKGGPG